jgi:hypothetical protein
MGKERNIQRLERDKRINEETLSEVIEAREKQLREKGAKPAPKAAPKAPATKTVAAAVKKAVAPKKKTVKKVSETKKEQ